MTGYASQVADATLHERIVAGVVPWFAAVTEWPVDRPVPGWYRLKLVKGGCWVGAEIRFEPPRDPVTNELLDRSWRWYAVVDGRADPVRDHGLQPTKRVWWVYNYGQPVAREIHDWLVADRAHARAWRPDSPEANPLKRIDLGKEPIVF